MSHNQDPTAPHLTFDELGDAFERGEVTQEQVYPCACYLTGHAEQQNGEPQRWRRHQVLHPQEFDEGQQAAYEQAYDL